MLPQISSIVLSLLILSTLGPHLYLQVCDLYRFAVNISRTDRNSLTAYCSPNKKDLRVTSTQSQKSVRPVKTARFVSKILHIRDQDHSLAKFVLKKWYWQALTRFN